MHRKRVRGVVWVRRGPPGLAQSRIPPQIAQGSTRRWVARGAPRAGKSLWAKGEIRGLGVSWRAVPTGNHPPV
jgi:hypothetical protein